ncbi:MAG: SpoIVB peptidase [Lachnospira sp.]|nr:SpoIVB peptidase [Lachnospira sp.]
MSKFIKFLCALAVVTCMITIAVRYVNNINDAIPGHIYVVRNKETTLDLSIPVTGKVHNKENTYVTFKEPVTFRAKDIGNYELSLKLFDIFTLPSVQVSVVDEQNLYACGMQAGLYIETDGVYVVSTEEITTEDNTKLCPCQNIIMPGDYITSVNGVAIKEKEQLCEAVQNCEGNSLDLEIIRDNQTVYTQVTPVRAQDGNFKIGTWIKDDAQGIGTITYLDSDMNYGALGHGIADRSSNQTLDIKNGQLYKTNIISIVKGEKGSPGELVGTIDYKDSNIIGTINKNSANGIFGKITNQDNILNNLQSYPVGYEQDVHKGNAAIRMYHDGSFHDYEIVINEVMYNSNRNLSFIVTSKDLLELTNGIVQGMSGCPIIQDGKIIGAVTHVLVDEPTNGYGIFIENMLKQ